MQTSDATRRLYEYQFAYHPRRDAMVGAILAGQMTGDEEDLAWTEARLYAWCEILDQGKQRKWRLRDRLAKSELIRSGAV